MSLRFFREARDVFVSDFFVNAPCETARVECELFSPKARRGWIHRLEVYAEIPGAGLFFARHTSACMTPFPRYSGRQYAPQMLFMPVFHVRYVSPLSPTSMNATVLESSNGREKSCAAFFGGGDPVGKFLFGCAHEARAASKVV